MNRDTQQREAIRQVISAAHRPLSVGEIFEMAKKKVSGLGIATVYRNIKDLQKSNFIVQVDLPGQPPRWELSASDHHHHFLCDSCDRVFEINNCLGDITRLLPKGYVLETHDILLRGKCDSCAHKLS